MKAKIYREITLGETIPVGTVILTDIMNNNKFLGHAQLIPEIVEEDILKALQTAKETIRIWHGEGEVWNLYQHSPEMKLINNVIKLMEDKR